MYISPIDGQSAPTSPDPENQPNRLSFPSPNKDDSPKDSLELTKEKSLKELFPENVEEETEEDNQNSDGAINESEPKLSPDSKKSNSKPEVSVLTPIKRN